MTYELSLDMRFALSALLACANIFLVRTYAVRVYDRAFGNGSEANDLGFWFFSAIAVAIFSALSASHLLGVIGFNMVGASAAGILMTDLRYHLIPDRLQIGATIGAMCTLAASQASTEDVIIAVLFALGSVLLLGSATYCYERYRNRPAMGWGDIKLIAWGALLVGPNIIYVVFGACLLGALFTFMQFMRRNKIEPFAFAPALLMALVWQALIR